MKDGVVLVDSQPLVFFHFHGLKKIHRFLFDPSLNVYNVRIDNILKRNIYAPYIKRLQETTSWLHPLLHHSHLYLSSIRKDNSIFYEYKSFRKIMKRIRDELSVIKGILLGYLWVVINGRIL